MKTAIFLGAGASAAEGAPIQTTLFRDYFKLLKKRRSNHSVEPEHERELATFFQLMFDIDVDHGNLDTLVFPTFEEALGVLDLADLKNEAFKDFPNINFASNSGRIKFLRLYLVFLMADIINQSLQQSRQVHEKLMINLVNRKLINNALFLTTNYDILCDNALLNAQQKIDYGIDFINPSWSSLDKSIKLFKLHGSLNWLNCPTCNNIRITPYEKSVYTLIVDPSNSFCKTCETVYAPIIVPPTFYKDLSKVFLTQVWNKAEGELLNAEHLIFCGYSFPDADIHIKYLLKRIQKNRPQPHKLKITVVNNHMG